MPAASAWLSAWTSEDDVPSRAAPATDAAGATTGAGDYKAYRGLPPPIAQNLMEFPYFITGPYCARIVMTMAARGDQISQVYSVDESGVETETDQPFTPYGVLEEAYPAATAMDDPIGFTLAASPSVDISTLTSCSPAQRLTGLTCF